MQPDLLHTVAAILAPKAWDGEERPSERLRTQIKHRQTASKKRARTVIAAVAAHLTSAGEAGDA